LEIGFGIAPEVTPIEVVRVINDRQIDWALGSVLNSLIGAMLPKGERSPKSGEDVGNERLANVINTNNGGLPVVGAGGSNVTVWLSVAMVPIVACYVVIKRVLPKWRR
jgi:hypothetical protein